MSEIKIQVKDNGPFLVTGSATITDAAGNVFSLNGKETFALCRCGARDERRRECRDEKVPTSVAQNQLPATTGP